MFTPGALFGMWIRGLLAIVLVAGGIYLFYCWQDELPRSLTSTHPFGAEQAMESRELRSFQERLAVWRPGWNKATAYLAGGILLSVWSVSGNWFYPRLLRKAGKYSCETSQLGKPNQVPRPDGTVLCVKSYGDEHAPRVILTHGWGCDHKIWDYVITSFSKNFRVIVWDLPGLGDSTEPQNNDYSMNKLAADLRAVLDHTGHQPAILVGHSIGGMATLTFCKLYPDLLNNLVRGIVVVHTTYTNPLKTTRFAALWTALQKPLIEPLLWLTIMLSPLVWMMNCLSFLNGSAHRSTDRSSFAGDETKGQLDFVARYIIKASPRVIAKGMFGMLNYDVSAALAHVHVPSLIFVGDGDTTTKPEAGEYIHTQILNSHLITITSAKHLGFFEHHGDFSRSLELFLTDTHGVATPAGDIARAL